MNFSGIGGGGGAGGGPPGAGGGATPAGGGATGAGGGGGGGFTLKRNRLRSASDGFGRGASRSLRWTSAASARPACASALRATADRLDAGERPADGIGHIR